MITRGQIDDRRLQKVGIVFSKIQLTELVGQSHSSIVGDVEEVGNEAYFRPFIDHPWIVGMQVELREERSSTKFATTTHRNLPGV